MEEKSFLGARVGGGFLGPGGEKQKPGNPGVASGPSGQECRKHFEIPFRVRGNSNILNLAPESVSANGLLTKAPLFP